MAKLQILQAQAAEKSVQVQLEAAPREYARAQRLAKGGAAAASRLDAAKTALKGAEAALAQARVALKMARHQRRETEQYSPIDGVVTRKLLHEVPAVLEHRLLLRGVRLERTTRQRENICQLPVGAL